VVVWVCGCMDVCMDACMHVCMYACNVSTICVYDSLSRCMTVYDSV